MTPPSCPWADLLDPAIPHWRFPNQAGGWISPAVEFSAKPNGPWIGPGQLPKTVTTIFDTGAAFSLMNTGLVEELALRDTGTTRVLKMANGAEDVFSIARGFLRLERADHFMHLLVAHSEKTRRDRILLPVSTLHYYHVLLTHSESIWFNRS
ncbi:MAG TPA: hypothetical protein DDY91_07640 [Planctomycetaceae bacterium]|nr:hypothetical protein [Planctomycetaceae bacterium]